MSEICPEKEEIKKEIPKIFFRSITFNDGTTIPLKNNSIVIFTGANNCGKSQFLKDCENILDSNYAMDPIVVTKVECEFYGDIDEPNFLQNNFDVDYQGNYKQLGTGCHTQLVSLQNWWKEHKLFNSMHKLFIKRLSTEQRLTVSNALQRSQNLENHPIYKLSNNGKLMRTVSDYFQQAFGVGLVLNYKEMLTIPLHVGGVADWRSFTMDREDEYYKIVKDLPQLQNQGDGMRSFASIVLDTFTSEYPITLIDEPEAFLHPPQARVLGKMLARNNPENRQLFISTHSEDFLQGLIDADNDNVTVIRINRVDDINKMNVLENEEIKKLWSNPILRYSNILSGLFHEKVVVCESDYDCLFYQAVMNAMYEHKKEIAPDILFTYCGGKQRAKDIVVALKAVNVPVVAVCDFDLLNNSQNFKSLFSSFGADWATMLSADMKTIYDSMNAKAKENFKPWEYIKKVGKEGFVGGEYAAYEAVEAVCKSVGLFVVPAGEIECFDKTINKEKKDWVYSVLETYDLATEPKLESARKFVQEIADFKFKN